MDANGPDPALVGLKVFFVRPHSVLQQELVETLVRAEFEVGQIKDQTKAEALFRRHPNCIAFLNIDEGWTLDEWDAFVAKLLADPALKGVRLGIVTYNESPELAEHYLLDMELAAGFVKLNLGMADSTDIMLKALEANEARGRRRYLRVHCRDNSQLNLKTDEGTLEGRILDLSSVGMACTLPEGKTLPVHAVLSSIQLKLKGSLCLVNGVVMGSRPLDDGGGRAFVVLFDPKTPPAQKDKIRTYLQWALQTSIEEMFA